MIPLLATFLCLAGFFFYENYSRQREQLDDILRKTAHTFQRLIEAELRADIGAMSIALESIVQDHAIQDMLAAQDKPGLHRHAQSTFTRLASVQRITHYYFYRTDRSVLLRLHNPDHADDKIDRHTLVTAAKTGTPTYGVEQGPTGASVLRVIYPTDKVGRRIGYVELGKELQDIVYKIRDLLAVDALVVVDKQHIDRDRWENRNNKADYEVTWDFLPGHAIMASTLPAIPSEVSSLAFKPSSDAYLTQLTVTSGEKQLDAIVVPYTGMVDDRLTQIVLFYDSTSMRRASWHALWVTALAGITIASALLVFFFLFLGRVEQLLLRQQATITYSSKMASLGEMSGGIAHEINNPLAIIQSLAGQLVASFDKAHAADELGRSIASAIESATKRIARIVQGLKSFSRQADGDPVRKVSLEEVVSNTLDLCAEKFRAQGIEIRVRLPPAVSLFCRDVQLSQVLLNLLNNAYDAMQDAPEKWVELEAWERSGTISIAITDSGRGIAPETADKIMQPFFTTKRVGFGTGLGLSIAQGIIESHRGKLYYDSTHPRTRFVTELPSATLASRVEAQSRAA